MEKTDKPQAQTGEQQSGTAGGKGGAQTALKPHSEVENAHAAGVGAMGRNDEKLPSGEDGTEAKDEPVY